MLSLRRRHSRWRMFPVLLFLGMICSGELAPIRVPEETLPATSSSSTSKKKDIGSLSDYWQAWLLVDSQGFQPGLDSATLLRRITPKSVFIAPVLPACAEGYQADKMGRCVKSITINATAHKDFILERLKLMFGNPQTKNDQKKSTGPLQLNIPLIPNVKPQSTEVELDGTFSANQPVAALSLYNETYFAGGEEKIKPHETNLYDVKNDTALDEEKSTFFLRNSSVDIKKIDRKSPATVSVTELVEETNDTNFSEVMDYKIPIDLKALLNSSKRVNASDGAEESVSEKRENSTEMSPALVLLISPTKLTNVVDDLSLTQNGTAEEVTQMSNFTSNTNESVPLDEQRDNETHAEDELAPEISNSSESQEVEFFYDEEGDDVDYPYSTDLPDEEDSAEGEELLKHGEAGMTIPTRDVERLDRDHDRHRRQRNQTADPQKTLDMRGQDMIRFNDSAPTEDNDEAGSNVSSEVSIDGDFILETTLLDVNTERLQVTTKSPDVTEKIVKDSENGFKESYDKSPDVVPEVIFSQDAHGAMSTSSHGREQAEQLYMKIKNELTKQLKALASSESLLHDSPEEEPITEIRMINDPHEKQSNAKDSVLQESPKNSQSTVPMSSSTRTTMNFDSIEERDFVRFPDYARQPQQGNYVRFPSNEANSIHNLNYKQNSRYPTDNVNGGTSTKSSVPSHQKLVYHLTASSWKPDRSQSDRVQTTANERQNRRPDLMQVWSKMPLIRDPAIYPVYQGDEATDNYQAQSHDQFFRPRSSRRLSPFTETSPGNRVQKRKTPIGV